MKDNTVRMLNAREHGLTRTKDVSKSGPSSYRKWLIIQILEQNKLKIISMILDKYNSSYRIHLYDELHKNGLLRSL